VPGLGRLEGTDPERFIPLTPFGPAWRGGDLGADLRRVAPHLFAPGERAEE